MAELNSICVYCGSGTGADPAYVAAAETLGRNMAEAGVRLVYGGGSVGLMGTLARAVLDSGGDVTGIIPHFLERRERMMTDLPELLITEDMHERKMRMFERADAFVALPGGVGTLEELVEQMTWSQLGQHEKPVLIANIAGFWDPLLRLLQNMRTDGFIRGGMEVSYLVAEDVDEIVPMLRRALADRPAPAIEEPVEKVVRQM
jgi:uncharacterized protein (TIGR00730 family)